MKTTTWLVTALLALAAHDAAATWTLAETATNYEWGWSTFCDVQIRGAETTVVEMNRGTMHVRHALGEDIYRPIISLAGDASNGETRPSIFDGSDDYRGVNYDLSEECVYNTPIELEGDYRWRRDASDNWLGRGTTVPAGGDGCKVLGVQYRITYSLGEGAWPWPREEAWVYNTTTRTYRDDGTLRNSYATVRWLDYPDDLFDTDETKTLRINMNGSRDYLGMRTTWDHIRHQNVVYSRGAEMLRLQRACIDRNAAIGRIVLPSGRGASSHRSTEAMPNPAFERGEVPEVRAQEGPFPTGMEAR